MPPDQLNDYLNVSQAAKALGCGRRTIYRLLERAGDGIAVEAFGMTVIHKSKLPLLKKVYLPFGSKARSLACKKWGSAGGTQKRINRENAT